MGDRGNIVTIDNHGHKVYLYTHQFGYKIKEVAANALNRGRDRWDDATYLTRILFCEMVKDDMEGTTGYGISNQFCDNNNDIVMINCDNGAITLETENGEIKHGPYTFEEFVDKYSTHGKTETIE